MKIAQVSPLFESVPPQLYGGTERVVSYLTEELVRQGHDVTLFASGDSVTSAALVPACRRALRLDATCQDALAYHMKMLEDVVQRAADFDVIHFHTDYIHFSLARRSPTPTLTTLHGRLDLPDLVPLYREFDDIPLVSISDAQRRPLCWANWQGTVYHGLPEDLLPLQREGGRYLAFLGRVSPEKGLEQAIEIAERAGYPLRIAAKIDARDREYFERQLAPRLGSPGVEYIGEISETEKREFLGSALALLLPINWPEPFGLVMIEAMACGTPVIAFRRGSVAEIMSDAYSGFAVEDVESAVEAVERVSQLDREKCRQVFEERFTAARMARDYVALYQSVASTRRRAWDRGRQPTELPWQLLP